MRAGTATKLNQRSGRAVVRGYLAPRLRDSFAAGRVRRIVQEQLGHAEVATKMIYTHVLKQVGGAVCRPIDTMTLI